jgi:hypothetical protein
MGELIQQHGADMRLLPDLRESSRVIARGSRRASFDENRCAVHHLSRPRRSHFEHATSSIGSRSAMSPSVTAPLLLIVLGKSFRATGLDRHHRPPPKDAHSGDDHMTDRLQP